MTQVSEIVPWLIAAVAGAFVVVAAAALTRRGQGGELRGIDRSWSFAESWASNITVGATALIAVLASTDVISVLVTEEKARKALSVVLVASALATALVGLAPLLLKAFVSSNGYFHAGGLAGASFLTLTGVGIEVSIVAANADRLFGGDEPYVVISGLLVAALMAVYAFRSLHELFSSVDAPRLEPSDTLRAAQIVADAILASGGRPEMFGMEAVAAAAPSPRRRAAIL